MSETRYVLMKRSVVDEEGNMTDEGLMTSHQDINELYWFKGKHDYSDEDYVIYQQEKDDLGDWVEIEHTRLS